MYTKIYFDFDEKGKLREKPLILTAKACNAKYFELLTVTGRGHHGDIPKAQIRRVITKIATDPYNEDGSPPTVMFQIAIPHIQWLGNVLFIEGLEDPNMSWAGLIRPPYDDRKKRIPGVRYMTEEMVHGKMLGYDELLRQRITMA